MEEDNKACHRLWRRLSYLGHDTGSHPLKAGRHWDSRSRDPTLHTAFLGLFTKLQLQKV